MTGLPLLELADGQQPLPGREDVGRHSDVVLFRVGDPYGQSWLMVGWHLGTTDKMVYVVPMIAEGSHVTKQVQCLYRGSISSYQVLVPAAVPRAGTLSRIPKDAAALFASDDPEPSAEWCPVNNCHLSECSLYPNCRRECGHT